MQYFVVPAFLTAESRCKEFDKTVIETGRTAKVTGSLCSLSDLESRGEGRYGIGNKVYSTSAGIYDYEGIIGAQAVLVKISER